MTIAPRVDKDGNLLPDIQGRPNPNIFNTIPYYPGIKEPNIFQDARRRGLAGVIGGALDNLTMGATDFDRRGDSAFQKGTKDFLKSFIFGTQKGKSVGMPKYEKDIGTLIEEVSPGSDEKKPVPMPEIDFLPGLEGTPVPMPKPDFLIPNDGKKPVPMPDPSEKTTTQKVEEFLDPTGEQAEKRLESIEEAEKDTKTTTQKVEEFLDPTGEQAEKRLESINIGGKDYKIYTDKNTGKEFIPFDPRISENRGDFDRYGKPLTEEQKRMMQQGARIGSFIPNPYTEEQMREIGKENLKINF